MTQILIFTGIDNRLPVRSIGAYQIASQLRKNNYTVQVVDFLPQILQLDFKIFLEILEKYVDQSTLWIGFSSTFLVQSYNESIIKFNENQIFQIKKIVLTKNPKCRFVLGGANAFLHSNKELFNTYIEGYADNSAIEFTKWCEGKNPFLNYKIEDECIIINNDIKASTFNFQEDRFSWHESDAIEFKEALPIEISRGCIFKCKFCNFPLIGKKKNDYIKHCSILYSEFLENYEKYGTVDYFFLDDTYNESPQKIEILYENVFSKLNFKINFSTYLRLDLFNAYPDTLSLIKESGLKVAFFGIESLNNQSKKIIGKGISNEIIFTTLKNCKDVWGDDVIIHASFIIGLPYETKETIHEWIKIVGSDIMKIDYAQVHTLGLFPPIKNFSYDSEFMKYPEKYGYQFDQNGWINNMGLTRNDASNLSVAAIEYWRQKERAHVFFWGGAITLLSLGYTIEEAKKLINKNNKDIDKVLLRYRQKIKNYINNISKK